MQIASIHDSVKQIIDGKTYSNVATFNASATIAVVKGGTGGNVILNPVYEFGYKLTRPDANTINVYCRTGQDNLGQNPGVGGITLRTFDVPTKTMNNDRIDVYLDNTYFMTEYMVWDRPNDVWIYTYERLRSDPLNTATARVCLLKSTDGKRGRQFAAPIVQSAWNDYIVPLDVLPDSNGTSFLYLGKGSPQGLRRAQIAADGTLGALSPALIGLSAMTEGSIVDLGAGVFLGVFRVDTGGYLLQAKSTDYGATWTTFSSTGIGASTGAKVTPVIRKCSNRPGRLITVFNDRGAGNRDRASSGNLTVDALNNIWIDPTYIGTPANQGNSSLINLDEMNGEYLYVTAQQTGSPDVVTNLLWWVIRDNYSSTVQQVQAWL